ncbi:2Fe-2S iron-sulfur cluster-binding protein [Jatrophihabitans cynanchi]|uniref:2Fe-2S iron-sulfur cluster-binding protein n=1 Tax=Jatrophihabitans cynanchi TaxID=2944128 RepID=A0ABY7JYX0_9ACTN|nr:2Fe-2S iron-sulfur cluster-binding protein [Jatrophihabitans sp. SB3-54]WAX56354.1 2Fe-2S iron-sulfur cluster-binding protein [Jatrophihabitans sp. SB3-54]
MSQSHALRVRVAQVIEETADAYSLVLEPDPADSARFAYHAGQFLTVRVPTDRPGGAARCYSLCSSPALGEPLKITVKRTRDGYGSNWICDNVVEGSTLEVLRPSGTFTPRSFSGDFLLFAAGSGITPVMSILKSALHSGTGTVTLVYANRDENSVIFRDELAELGAKFADRFIAIHWLESVQGLPNRDALALLATGRTGANAYVCGPEPFMDAAVAALVTAGLPRERVHVERFLSLDNDPFADVAVLVDDGSGTATTVEVTLDGQTTTHAWPAGNHLLDVLLAAGLDAPFSCREGQCSACACKLIEGEVELDHNEVLEQEDLDDGYRLACQARAVTASVRVTYDE